MAKVLFVTQEGVKPEDFFSAVHHYLKGYKNHAYVGALVSNSGVLKEDKAKAAVADGWDEGSSANAADYFLFFAKWRGLQLQMQSKWDQKKIREAASYADMLLVDGVLVSQSTKVENIQGLLSVPCPLFILPEKPETVEQVVLVDNASPETVQVFRILQCLFPKWVEEMPISVLSILPEEEQEMIREKLLLDFLKQHSNNVGFQVFETDEIMDDAIIFAEAQKHACLVMSKQHLFTTNLWPQYVADIVGKLNIPLLLI